MRGVALSAMMVLTLTLTWGATVSLAADYQDASRNVCEGGAFASPGCPTWGSHVTGEENIALGDGMMPKLTSGTGNIATGWGALYSNTIGNDNIATGTNALNVNTSGIGNLASGAATLESNTTGTFNVAVGELSLRYNTTGNYNTANGIYALLNNTGSSNVGLGALAGQNLTTGANNIDIANQGVAGESATTRIGSEGLQAKTFVSGIYPTPPPGGSKTCTVKVTEAGQLVCSEPPAPKGLKICVQEKAGGNIKLPPCKKNYKEKEVNEL